MITTLAAALALTSALSLDVPFVPQTTALCGGAAVAMVFRYWGDSHADIQQFADLVDRRLDGIAAEVLVDAVRSRGWNASVTTGSSDLLDEELRTGRPVIVLIADRRDRYHYVVVTGISPDSVVVHDPSWGPSRRIAAGEFRRLWRASGFWSLVIQPMRSAEASVPEGSKWDAHPLRERRVDACDQLLERAVVEVTERGLDSAEAILGRVRAECPQSPGPLRELAGVRFGQKQWSDAAGLAREALALDRRDTYALDVLGSSLFMLDDENGAVDAWNRIGKPRVDAVHIVGLQRTRYQTITETLQLHTNALLTADRLQQARRRLHDLPSESMSHLELRPEPDGYARVDVVLVERATAPRGPVGWTSAAVRTAVERTVTVSVPGSTGQGEMWSASWRWWNNRPSGSVGFAAPRVAGLPGVWRVDASWARETYRFEAEPHLAYEERVHGAVSVGDWSSGSFHWTGAVGIDSWNGARKTASLSAGLERRLFDDRVSLSLDAAKWLGLASTSGFHSGGARAVWRSSTAESKWALRGSAGIETAGNTAPFSIWPGAGDGQTRAEVLRAHASTHGVIDARDGAAFGRTLAFANAEVQRWFERPALPRIGLAVFADSARATRIANGGGGPFLIDSGAGVRIKLPGVDGVLRADFARGLRDGANAITFGWQF